MKRSPVLITDARVSQEEDLKRRERRYVLMMGVRAACLILAGVLVINHVPLLAIWLPLCGLGMVFIPWLAVILVNDRPPKDKYRFKHNRTEPGPSNALPAQPTGKVIDADDE